MNIYDCLKKDHDKVKSLLSDLLAVPKDNKARAKELIEEIRDELIPHSRAEEAVFYNAIRAAHQDSEVMHGYKEHLEAETLLRTLQFIDKVGVDWKATTLKLKEALEHHIREEETQLFSQARQVISDEEAEKIGEAFEQLKPQVKEENILQTTADLVANLMPPRFTSQFRKETMGGKYHP